MPSLETRTVCELASRAHRLRHVNSFCASMFVSLLLSPAVALAQATPAPGPMARAGYSLPWNLRPAIAPDLLRVDAALAFHRDGFNTATLLTGGGRPFAAVRDLGFYGRLGVVTTAPDGADGRSSVVNPLVFALFTPQIAPGLRLPIFVGVSVPIGAGSDASSLQRATFGSGVYTRQAMDNAMFAGNFLTVTTGVGLAWIRRGFTAQAELTLLQLTRVWGESVEPDSARTNFTSGVHFGYQVIPALTVSVEGHYQRWLSTPKAVSVNDALRSQLTVGVGVRGNIPVGGALLRPGVAFFMPANGQMNAMDYRVLQFDVAATF